MFSAFLILIISTALLFFYLQATCQNILRRQFSQEYFQSIVHAYCLEFPSVRKAMQEVDGSVDYEAFCTELKGDFLALTYLLKHAAAFKPRYAFAERLLMLYFRALFLSVALRHALVLQEKAGLQKLTAVLEHFANVVGERVNQARFGKLTASEYIPTA
jgi:hypothetical protein